MGARALISPSVAFPSPETIETSTSPQLTVVFPREGAKIPYVKRSFVYGNVRPATAQVKINGNTIPVYRTGSFIGVIDFQPGSFPIYIESEMGEARSEVIRTVVVSSPTLPIPEGVLMIDLESVEPSQDRVAIEGDFLNFRFRGSPECEAEYRPIKKGSKSKESDWKAMREIKGSLGSVYQGTEQVKPQYKEEDFSIEYRLTDSSKQKKIARSSGKIKLLPQKVWGVAQVGVEEAVVKTGSSTGGDSMGYALFLPEGTPLILDGQIGPEARVFLSPTLRGWVAQSQLKEKNYFSSLPKSILSSFHAYNNRPEGLSINFGLSSKVPYKAELGDDLKTFKITFFYTISNLDRMRYDLNGFLGFARWNQSEENVVEMECRLNEKVWGYEIKYIGSQLEINFKFFKGKTSPKKKIKMVLAGLKIALDPGHSARLGDGTISPKGVLEGDFNLLLAKQLQAALEKAGAQVFLTREDGKSVELEERKKSAIKESADLFLSLHANAVGYGANPMERRGHSLFYFSPQSLPLAQGIKSSFIKSFSLPDDGLYYGNLAVCRMTEMPSVLIETGYLIHPQDEELLLDENFRSKIAAAIVEGVQRFIKEW